MQKINIFRSDFSKNLLALVTGTAIAQVINFVFSTFLTRLYSPDDFGAVSVFSSIVSFVLVVSCGKFDVALVAARSDGDAAKLFSISFIITIITSLLTVAAAFVIYFFSIRFYSASKVHDWLYLLPFSVLLLSAGQILWMWNVRVKNFKNISFVRIAEAVSAGAAAIGFYKMGALGLLLSMMVSQFVSFVMLGYIVRTDTSENKEGGFAKFKFSFAELKNALKDYADFPRINILQGFVDIFQMSAVILFLSSANFAGNVVGFYSLCMRVLQVPMRLIILPISHVFFAEASELHRKGGDLYALVKKTIKRTAIFALPIPLGLIFLGPWSFALVFGEEWREAGVYAQLLSVWIFFDLVRAPITQIASIVGKQNYVLYLSVLTNIFLLGILLYGVHYSVDPRKILMLVSGSQAMMTFFLILLILNISKRSTGNGQLTTDN